MHSFIRLSRCSNYLFLFALGILSVSGLACASSENIKAPTGDSVSELTPGTPTPTPTPPPTACTGSSSQACSIPHGTGSQSRTCDLGTWSAWSSCQVVSCDAGYYINSGTCALSPVVTYSLGGAISGLASGETLVLRANNNAGTLSNTLTLNNAETSYTMPEELSAGMTYTLQIVSGPTGKVCSVSNSSGAMTSDITNININCVAAVGNCAPSSAKFWNLNLFKHPNQDYMGIKAVACYGNSLYVGGMFDGIAPPVGPLAKLSTSGTGALNQSTLVDIQGGGAYSVVLDGSGGWFVAGTFAGGRTLIHVRSDNTIDPNWNPRVDHAYSMVLAGGNLYVATLVANGPIYKINAATGVVDTNWSVVSPLRAVYAMGFYGEYLYIAGVGGITRVQITSSGGGILDSNWSHTLGNGDAISLLVLGDGTLLVGGNFGGYVRKITTVGGRIVFDTSWNAAVSGSVNAMALTPNGKLYVGGDITSVGGQVRTRLARFTINASGLPVLDAWNAAAGDQVQSLAADNNYVYVGGRFTTLNDQTRNHIGRFSANGDLDSWNPNANGDVRRLALYGGNIFLVGTFQVLGDIIPRNNLAKFSLTTGAPDLNWNPIPDQTTFFNGEFGRVAKIAITDDGQTLYVNSSYRSNALSGGTEIYGLAKISATGTGLVASNWRPGIASRISVMAVHGSDLFVTTLDDNKLYKVTLGGVANDFGLVDREAMAISNHTLYYVEIYPYVLRKIDLNTGVIDPAWRIDLGSTNLPTALAVNGNDIFVATSGGPHDGYVKKFTTSSGGAVTFRWTVNVKLLSRSVAWSIYTLAVSGSDLYVGGIFDSVNNTPRFGLARFSADTGAFDFDWNYYTMGSGVPGCSTIVLSSDGSTVYTGEVNGLGRFSRMSP